MISFNTSLNHLSDCNSSIIRMSVCSQVNADVLKDLAPIKNQMFCAPQVLVMKTPTLCTQTTTTTCLVQTTSRSSPTGRHISKHWCHSCATRVILLLFCFPYLWFKRVVFPLQAFLLTSSCCLSAEVNAEKEKQERGGQRISLRQAVILSAERAETKILFQAKLYLCHHQMGFTMVQRRKLIEMTPSSHHSLQSKQISFRFSAASLVALLPWT